MKMCKFASVTTVLFSTFWLAACGGEQKSSQDLGGGVHKEPLPQQLLETTCPELYDPVCAVVPVSAQCLTQPCPTHEYASFSNQCFASVIDANVVLVGECGSLEGAAVLGDKSVSIVTAVLDANAQPLVSNAQIDGDVLSVNLTYSGCEEIKHDLNISALFMESHPVQASFAFVGNAGSCELPFTTQIAFDLRPLKLAYERTYQSSSGEIILPGLGHYIF